MPNLLELLDGHIFSGITGNFAYDILKNAWRQITRRSWETLYLDAFQAAVKEARARLAAYAGEDGEISVDQDALVRALHSDIQGGPKIARLSSLSDEEFIATLADAMVDRSVLTIGGHTLSRTDYEQVCRNLVRSATQQFRDAILADENAFRQALLAETQHNTNLVEQILRYTAAHFTIALDQIERVGANVTAIRQEMATSAQVDEVLRLIRTMPTDLQSGVAGDAQLRQQLATERERRWNDQFERLRRAVDKGYGAAVRDEIITLIDELQLHLASGGMISSDLQGSIYRLGAIAFLPSRPGGDVARARTYLRLARPHSNGEAALKCEIIEAVLLDATQGVGPALDLLAGLEGDEPRRMRFSLALKHEDLLACEQMIVDGSVNLEQAVANPLWTRPIMFYHAAVGPRERLLACVDVLTAPGQPADHLDAAALALTRAAFETFGRFCHDHQIFPEFHYMLDLEELIDAELRERAIRCFERSAEAYLEHQCHAEGVQALVSAIRLLMDLSEDAWRDRLLRRLREVDPANPLLATDNTHDTNALDQLERAFADTGADALLLLHRVRQAAHRVGGARQVVDLLIRQEARFRVNPLIQLQFEIGVSELLQEAGCVAEAETWLARVSSPAPYEHMRPLSHVAFYLPRNIDAARHWIEQARTVAPNQPEVLLTEGLVLGRTDEYAAAIDAAERLFELLRTRQTTMLRLDLLCRAGRFRELLDLLQQTDDVKLPEAERRGFLVTALIGLGQSQEAVGDLEWLVQQGKATVHGMLSLAQIYLRLHRQAEAIAILRRCVAEHADDPNSRMLLSNALLTQGQRDESFRIAVQARQHFPDDAAVALNLVHLAFPAGHEHSPEVQAALRALTPGGELAEAALVRLADVREAREMILASMQAAQEADRLYSQGQIPLLLRCYLLQFPLAWYHAQVRERLAIQFVAPWNGLEPPVWWNSPRLPAIVIDYPALLSLWSVFGEMLLSILRASIDRIYLPASLLEVMAWDQANLATQGQRALEQSRAQVQATLSQRPGRLYLHPSSAADGAVEPIAAGAALSGEQQLIYLTAYAPPDGQLDVPALDLPILADVLLRAGEIGPNEVHSLRQHMPCAAAQDASALARGADIITNTLTLVAIEQAGALEALLRYCGQLHLLEHDWEQLCGLVSSVSIREGALRDLDQLRALTAQAIDEQFFRIEALPPEQGLFQTSTTDEDGEAEDMPLRRLALRYIDELFGLAHRHQTQLWTDDRWTALVGLPDEMVIHRVNTDTMLGWLHRHGVLDEQRLYSTHAKLLNWGYQGLTVNEGYLRWIVRQGVDAQARLLIDTAMHYRSSLLGLWAVTGPQTIYGKQLYLVYLRALADTILGYFGDDADPDVVGTIIHNLEISRDWPGLLGKEPVHLSDILLHLVGLRYPDDPLAGVANSQISRFSVWLDQALQQAQYTPMAIDEAWRLTVERVLAIYDSFVAEHGRVLGYDPLLRLILRSMAERSLDRVLASPAGGRVRAYVGDMLRPEIVWTIQQSDGTTSQLAYPRQQWERDCARAVDQAVVRTDAVPVTIGVITLRPLQNRASLWLQFQLLPSARPELLDGPTPAQPDRFVGLFPRFADHRRAHRQAVWQIVWHQLAALGLPTQEWEQLRTQLLANNPRTWRAAAGTALRMMFGQWPLVRAIIHESIGLAPRALFDVLTRLEPDDARSWLGMGARVDAASLGRWADRTAASIILGNDLAAATTHLSEYFARCGHSLFPDAPIMRTRIAELIMAWPDVRERGTLLQHIVQQASESVSGALKTNGVLIALYCKTLTDWQPGNGADLDTVLAELVVAITAPRNPNDPQTAPVRLLAALTTYFYQAWRSRSHTSADELAYLAHMAASWIGEVLATCLSDEAAEQVIESLIQDTFQPEFREARQPVMLFRPAWVGLLNYGTALLLGASSELRSALAALLETTPATGAMVRCGASQRIVQELLNTGAAQAGWLDEPRASDVSTATADLFSNLDEAALGTWAETEQYALVMCRVPEAGLRMVTNAIVRLPEETDDAEVLKTVGMALLGIEAPGGLGEAIMTEVLAPQRLARIQRCSDCYNLLVWRISGVLANSNGYRSDLLTGILSALHTISQDPVVASDVAATIAGMFARRAMMGQLLDEQRNWLTYLGTSEEIPLPAVRKALGILLYWWPELSSHTRNTLRPILDALTNVPNVKSLWELRRLRERN